MLGQVGPGHARLFGHRRLQLVERAAVVARNGRKGSHPPAVLCQPTLSPSPKMRISEGDLNPGVRINGDDLNPKPGHVRRSAAPGHAVRPSRGKVALLPTNLT